MAFPVDRPRRLRDHPALRAMISETCVHARHLVQPLFVKEGLAEPQPIPSMPGQRQLPIEAAADAAKRARDAGVGAVLLFGIPAEKDPVGSAATDPEGVFQRTTGTVKDAAGDDLAVICDVCLCEYTDHGHCGVLGRRAGRQTVDNDATLLRLAEMAVGCARAGADVVAPSDMMDGRVAAVRDALDEADLAHVPILSYAVKYASSFYGPFRDAAESAPAFGDRRGYQMDPANADEALREAAADVEEGADLLMVKPALAYGDVVARVRETFAVPTGAYCVSGSYAMVEAAAARGWIDREAVIREMLLGLRRAGADFIVTYWATEIADALS